MGAIVDTVLARWFTPDFAAAQPEAVAPCATRFLANDPARLRSLLRARSATWTCAERLGGITQPTLIIAGAEDPATPVAMMAGHPHAHPAGRADRHAAGRASPGRRAAGRVERHLAALPRARPAPRPSAPAA